MSFSDFWILRVQNIKFDVAFFKEMEEILVEMYL